MAKYWEIVQLSDNRFALRSSEEAESPMVEIQFSAEAQALLQGQLPDIARAMISAGVQSVTFQEEYDEQMERNPAQIVH